VHVLLLGVLRVKPVVSVDNEARALTHIDVEYDTKKTGARDLIVNINNSMQYQVVLASQDAADNNSEPANVWTMRFIVSFLFCLPIIFFAYLCRDDVLSQRITEVMYAPSLSQASIASLLSFVCATPIITYSASPLFASAYKSLYYRRTLNMDVLVSLSAAIAYLYSTVILLINLSGTHTEGINGIRIIVSA
jgi:cation transport ATPase